MAGLLQDDEAEEEVMSEINMVPFIDVMLVLLIVFMITVPVMKNAVNVQLPQASAQRLAAVPDALRLAVSPQGPYLLNEQPVADADLEGALRAAAANRPQVELHIAADKDARYERVARAMAAAQRAGVGRLGFVTEPEPAR